MKWFLFSPVIWLRAAGLLSKSFMNTLQILRHGGERGFAQEESSWGWQLCGDLPCCLGETGGTWSQPVLWIRDEPYFPGSSAVSEASLREKHPTRPFVTFFFHYVGNCVPVAPKAPALNESWLSRDSKKGKKMFLHCILLKSYPYTIQTQRDILD